MLAHKHIIIGTCSSARRPSFSSGFCSADAASARGSAPTIWLPNGSEWLHLKLVDRKIVTDHEFHRGARTVFWLLFSLLAVVSGYTVFGNPVADRHPVAGADLTQAPLAPRLGLPAADVRGFHSRRAWCRYVCPIGLTYGMVGTLSPVRVLYRLEHCFHEGDWEGLPRAHVLDMVVKGRAEHTHVPVGPDCTRCGLCIDVVPPVPSATTSRA